MESVRRQLVLTQHLDACLDDIAKALDRSRSSVVRQLVEREYERLRSEGKIHERRDAVPSVI